MRNNTGLLKIIGFIAAAVIVGVGLGWLASRPKTVAHQTVEASESAPTAATTAKSSSAAAQPTPELAPDPTITINAPAPGEMPPKEDWGDKIANILTDGTEFPQKCKDMLALYPDLPDDGKLEIVQHLNNLIENENYAAMGKILIDPKTPTAVGEAMMNDLFNRPGSLKIPLMLQVARTPGHPLAEAARENLVLFLEEDHGNDWAQWEKTATTWLKSNPD